MQNVFNEVAKRLMSENPDSDRLLAMLLELHTIEMHIEKEDWGRCLTNVATSCGLEIPECLK